LPDAALQAPRAFGHAARGKDEAGSQVAVALHAPVLAEDAVPVGARHGPAVDGGDVDRLKVVFQHPAAGLELVGGLALAAASELHPEAPVRQHPGHPHLAPVVRLALAEPGAHRKRRGRRGRDECQQQQKGNGRDHQLIRSQGGSW
jgi:hypothetical protein